MSDTRLPPSRKGSDTDLYDEMCEKYIRVHRVNESSTIAMCFVPENIVTLRGRGNDEEEGLEEKRTRRISGADGNEHVQRLVEEYAAFMYGLCWRCTQGLPEETRDVPQFSRLALL